LELLRFELLLPGFALVLARVAGLMLSVPMLASSQIPRMAKAWLVVVLSLMAYPAVAPHLPESLTLGEALAGMLGEFVIGEVLGLGVGMVFFAAQIAGQVVGHQSGLSLGQVFNPLYDEESTVLDQVWFFAALMVFLALRGHLAVVEALLRSFNQLPPMSLIVDLAWGDFLVALVQSVFETALRLSGPAVLALLLTSLIMGFLTKTMPQLNVLSVGFSLKIGVAFLMVAVTLSSSGGIIGDAAADGLNQVGLLFEHAASQVIHAG